MTTPADHMTITEIIHDFATRQGDLTDRWVREDLAAILERRMVAERIGALTDYADLCADRESHMATRPKRGGKENTADGRERNVWSLAAYELRQRAEQIRSAETEGAS